MGGFPPELEAGDFMGAEIIIPEAVVSELGSPGKQG